jgi:hypothetical protein
MEVNEMKKMLMVLSLALASIVEAGPRFSYVFVQPRQFLQGDGFTAPLSAASNSAIYWSMFKSNTVGSMAAATGVSMTAQFKVPTNFKPGYPLTIGFTCAYSGVTNSAVLSGTAKVQVAGYSDYGFITSTALTVSSQIQITNANTYGGPTQYELVDIPNVYPGSIIDVYLERIAGTNSVLHLYEVWAKFEPSSGWLW